MRKIVELLVRDIFLSANIANTTVFSNLFVTYLNKYECRASAYVVDIQQSVKAGLCCGISLTKRTLSFCVFVRYESNVPYEETS